MPILRTTLTFWHPHPLSDLDAFRISFYFYAFIYVSRVYLNYIYAYICMPVILYTLYACNSDIYIYLYVCICVCPELYQPVLNLS